MAFNYWFEHTIDAYLRACASGIEDWRGACREAERVYDGPVRVLTREDLAAVKGIRFSRQHIDRKVRNGTFPRPFQTPSLPRSQSSKSSSSPRKRQKRKRADVAATTGAEETAG